MPDQLNPVKEKKPFSWMPVNIIIAALLLLNPLEFCVIGISIPLCGVLLLLCALMYHLHRKHRRTGKCRLSMLIVRIVSIGLALLYAAAPLVLLSFENNPHFYHAKKCAYFFGVNISPLTWELLPDRLPKECEDYYMLTQGASLAQDHHSSIYLMFRTDPETMDQYAAHMSQLEKVSMYENTPPSPDDPQYPYYMDPDPCFDNMRCPAEFPMDVYGRMLRAGFTDPLDHAVYYVVPDYYNKGCLLNYETGLVVFWI